MRIATSTLFGNLERRIQQLTESLNTVNEKMASQKKINRPSDNPLGAGLGHRVPKPAVPDGSVRTESEYRKILDGLQ